MSIAERARLASGLEDAENGERTEASDGSEIPDRDAEEKTEK